MIKDRKEKIKSFFKSLFTRQVNFTYYETFLSEALEQENKELKQQLDNIKELLHDTTEAYNELYNQRKKIESKQELKIFNTGGSIIYE